MLTELVSQIKNRQTTAWAVVKKYLEAIKHKDPEIGAFLEVFEKEALFHSKQIDSKLKQNETIGPLAGIPIALKDNILVAGHKSTAGSLILENYIASYNAFVTEKLKKAGAIILGKTNLDEFAHGSSTEKSAFQTTKNPFDLSRVPGGSSGGSAAAVAAGMVPAALGSDTGGSIRQPASFCGVVGFKPTYGTVSRRGLIAMASSMDQIGPVTQTVSDCKLIFSCIAGKDPLDATSFDLPAQNSFNLNYNKIKLGLPKEFWQAEGLGEPVKELLENQLDKLRNKAATIKELSLPLSTQVALAAYYIVMPAEVSSNLARYDGVKYGLSQSGQSFLDRYFKTRAAGFGLEVKRRILLGTYVLSAGYKDRYYQKAQQVRQAISEEYRQVFQEVDFVLTPTTPHPAFKLGDKLKDPVAMYLEDLFTVSANLAGLPAICLPAGWVGRLPIGLQLIGPKQSDWRLLELAEKIEDLLKNR